MSFISVFISFFHYFSFQSAFYLWKRFAFSADQSISRLNYRFALIHRVCECPFFPLLIISKINLTCGFDGTKGNQVYMSSNWCGFHVSHSDCLVFLVQVSVSDDPRGNWMSPPNAEQLQFHESYRSDSIKAHEILNLTRWKVTNHFKRISVDKEEKKLESN